MSAEPNRSNHSEESNQPAGSDLLSGFQDRVTRASLRQRLEGWAESLDLTLPRLVAGAAAVAVLGVVGWRLLDTPSAPPEMALPMTSGSGQDAPGGSSEPGRAATDDPGEIDGGPPARGEGAAGTDGAEPSGLVVHVAGAVREPGVQRLGPEARVVDAVEAAGGATDDADLARVNLAAPLEDGQQVYLPRVGEDPPEATPPLGGSTPAAGTSGSVSGPGDNELVNINTAGTTELEALHGIGPALAQAIVDHRNEHGPFTSIEQLTDVRGIGQAKLDGVRDQVTL